MKAGIKAPLTQPAINKRSLILSASPRIGVFLTYKNKDTALEHISNEVNEPLEDIKEYFKEHNEYKSGKYVYKIEESELQ